MLIIPEFWILIRASSAPILEKAWIRPEHSDPNKAIEERIWIRAVKSSDPKLSNGLFTQRIRVNLWNDIYNNKKKNIKHIWQRNYLRIVRMMWKKVAIFVDKWLSKVEPKTFALLISYKRLLLFLSVLVNSKTRTNCP